MNQAIHWRRIGDTEWTPGTLVDGLDGLLAIKLSDRPTYLTTDRNGTTRSANSIGEWEGRYELSTSTPTLKIKPNVVTYVYEIHEL